jgi:hypothetical protein
VPQGGTGVVDGAGPLRRPRQGFTAGFPSYDTKRSIGSEWRGGRHHPGTGCARARPSSAEEGSKNVQTRGGAWEH